MADTILTTNVNLLQTTKFKLVFNRLPNVEYFLTGLELPGVNLVPAVQPNPFRDRPVPGDKLMWDNLSIVFNVDEMLENWREVHSWMYGLGKPTSFEDYKKLKEKSSVYSDASLIVTSSHNNATLRYNFVDCWPTSLMGFRFMTTGSANEPLVSEAIFCYSYYTVEIL